MKTRFDIQLSEHFMLSEFIRSDTAKAYGILEQYVISNEIYHNLKDLVLYVLQPLRYAVGEIIINSGYRCEKLKVRLTATTKEVKQQILKPIIQI